MVLGGRWAWIGGLGGRVSVPCPRPGAPGWAGLDEARERDQMGRSVVGTLVDWGRLGKWRPGEETIAPVPFRSESSSRADGVATVA